MRNSSRSRGLIFPVPSANWNVVREIGEMVWTYLGPPELEPPFPAYDWLTMPGEERAIVKLAQRSNFLQGLEGSIS